MNNIKELRTWYVTLTKQSLEEMNNFYDVDCYFKDPFNEFSGRDNIKKVFDHMFEKLDDPRFVFIDIIDSQNQSFITWDFIFSLNGKEFIIHGSSHLKWENDVICYHRDYWDVGEELLLKVPVMKSFYKFFQNKLKVVN